MSIAVNVLLFMLASLILYSYNVEALAILLLLYNFAGES